MDHYDPLKTTMNAPTMLDHFDPLKTTINAPTCGLHVKNRTELAYLNLLKGKTIFFLLLHFCHVRVANLHSSSCYSAPG